MKTLLVEARAAGTHLAGVKDVHLVRTEGEVGDRDLSVDESIMYACQ